MLPLLVLLSLGCVPKKGFEALQADLDATRVEMELALYARDETIAERDARIGDLEAALVEEQEDLAALEAEYEKVKEEYEAALQELRADQATLISDRSALRASIADMEEALADLAARKAAADARVDEYGELLDRFATLIDAGRLRVKIVDGRMVMELATDILFKSGSASLSPEGEEAILEVAAILAEIPERRFLIEGHTDNVPISTERFPSNWELAAVRAITVTKTLIVGGVAPESVSGASFAEYRPVGDNETEEGRSANRRIEIVVVPDLSQLPGFEELEALADEEE